jgi:hypothetical protein
MMAELKKKEDQLTTADLAGRAENKGRTTPESQTDQERTGPTLVKTEPPSQGESKKTVESEHGEISSAAIPGANWAPLFAESEVTELRARWSAVQSDFVDEPRRTVEEADKLVATVMQRLADGFAGERSNLEKQWGRGDNVSTEDLRVALQRYRSFFDRLLRA